MDASEPRVRHRGYFLNSAESDGTDPAEEAAAEGVKIRVRIVRPRAKRRAAGAMRRTQRVLISATATGSRRPSRWPR
jgi:hypothetical protein